jgi:hypothetical protein
MFVQKRNFKDAIDEAIAKIGTPDYTSSSDLPVDLPPLLNADGSFIQPDFFASAGTVVSDLLKGILGQVPSFLDTANKNAATQQAIDKYAAAQKLSQAEAAAHVSETNARTVQLVGVAAIIGTFGLISIVMLKKKHKR